LLQNPYDIVHLTLGVLLHYLRKAKIQIFCRYGRKFTKLDIFGVQCIESFSIL